MNIKKVTKDETLREASDFLSPEEVRKVFRVSKWTVRELGGSWTIALAVRIEAAAIDSSRRRQANGRTAGPIRANQD